jgi:hypothetical protein
MTRPKMGNNEQNNYAWKQYLFFIIGKLVQRLTSRNYFQAGNHVYERLEVSEALRKALKIDSVVCGHALRSIILHNFSWECVLQVRTIWLFKN